MSDEKTLTNCCEGVETNDVTTTPTECCENNCEQQDYLQVTHVEDIENKYSDYGEVNGDVANTVVPENLADATVYNLLRVHEQLENVNTYKKTINDSKLIVVKDNNILATIEERIDKISLEDLKAYTDEQIDEIFTIDGNKVDLSNITDDKKKEAEFKRDYLIYLKESNEALKKIDEETKHLEEYLASQEAELNAALEAYGDMSTYFYKKMKKDLEHTTDPKKKEKIEKMVYNYEDAMKFETLYKHYQKYSTKNTIGDYHNDIRSQRLYEKYRLVMGKLGLKSDLTSFDQLETRFLPEQYHKYPNLFLFSIIKYFAHRVGKCEKDVDGIFLSQLSVNLKKLYTDKFKDEEIKNEFLANIMKVLDLFYQN